MPTIPAWVIEAGVRKLIDVVKGDSKEEKKPEEKKPAEEKPKQETKKEYKEGGVTKSDVQKVARREVKKHEKSMHGMKTGGYVRSADGCAKRGKTKGRMV